ELLLHPGHCVGQRRAHRPASLLRHPAADRLDQLASGSLLGWMLLLVHRGHTLAPGGGEGHSRAVAPDVAKRAIYRAPVGATACRSRWFLRRGVRSHPDRTRIESVTMTRLSRPPALPSGGTWPAAPHVIAVRLGRPVTRRTSPPLRKPSKSLRRVLPVLPSNRLVVADQGHR